MSGVRANVRIMAAYMYIDYRSPKYYSLVGSSVRPCAADIAEHTERSFTLYRSILRIMVWSYYIRIKNADRRLSRYIANGKYGRVMMSIQHRNLKIETELIPRLDQMCHYSKSCCSRSPPLTLSLLRVSSEMRLNLCKSSLYNHPAIYLR